MRNRKESTDNTKNVRTMGLSIKTGLRAGELEYDYSTGDDNETVDLSCTCTPNMPNMT